MLTAAFLLSAEKKKTDFSVHQPEYVADLLMTASVFCEILSSVILFCHISLCLIV